MRTLDDMRPVILPSPRRAATLALIMAAAAFAASVSLVAQPPQPPGGPVPPGPDRGQGPTAVADLTVAQRQAFATGARTFAKQYTVAEGLGPVFNDQSCANCHRGGNGSNRVVTRIGRLEGTRFDSLEYRGGSLLQSRGIGDVTTADGTFTFRGETVPGEATTVADRRSQPLLGLGFVDAVPDMTFWGIALEQQTTDPATAGRPQLVFDLTTGRYVVGRFGWKAQAPTLKAFAADALLNEMGITSPGFHDEICPQGDCLALGFNPTPALNDDGRDVEAIADFMTMLAPLPRGPVDDQVVRGEAAFESAGCATCHRPTLTTGPSPIRALAHATFAPYSDFLLHDMGRLGDGIVQESAGPREMRTAPLWGVRVLNRFLHDGSAQTLDEAIRRHDGQGRPARDRYEALSQDLRDALVAFVRSL